MQNILLKNKGLSQNKVLFLPNGVDINLFKPSQSDYEWQIKLKLENKQVILYAGTHGYAHGMEVLLDTAQLLEKTNIIFLLVGGGSEKARLEQRCTEQKLTNVLFLPPQPPENIARLYSLAVAGISTLRDSPLFEGTRPVKIFATMACGKPVIYSGKGEGANIVITAQAGIVVPPQDAKKLANAIQQIVNNTDYASQLGQNGRCYVEQHLQWSTVVTRWLQRLS
jgi:colanic acid biosynthesis glycosyl transferase WcaI